MEDYSNWEPILDNKNDLPYVDPNRPWLKHRPVHIPKTIKFDPISVYEFIKLSISRFPNNLCIYHKLIDRKYTYQELIHYADSLFFLNLIF